MNTAANIKTRIKANAKLHPKWKLAKKMWILYLFLLGPVAIIFVFKYIPIYGLYMALVDFKAGRNIFTCPWNNFEYFKIMFNSNDFSRYFFNTIIISLLKIIFVFPAPLTP